MHSLSLATLRWAFLSMGLWGIRRSESSVGRLTGDETYWNLVVSIGLRSEWQPAPEAFLLNKGTPTGLHRRDTPTNALHIALALASLQKEMGAGLESHRLHVETQKQTGRGIFWKPGRLPEVQCCVCRRDLSVISWCLPTVMVWFTASANTALRIDAILTIDNRVLWQTMHWEEEHLLLACKKQQGWQGPFLKALLIQEQIGRYFSDLSLE